MLEYDKLKFYKDIKMIEYQVLQNSLIDVDGNTYYGIRNSPVTKEIFVVYYNKESRIRQW